MKYFNTDANLAHSPALVRAIVALIAYPDEGARADVRVADDAAAVALLAQPPDGHARLLAAEDEIRVMLRHREAEKGTKCRWLRLKGAGSQLQYGAERGPGLWHPLRSQGQTFENVSPLRNLEPGLLPFSYFVF